MEGSRLRAVGRSLLGRLASAYTCLTRRPEWPVVGPILLLRLVLDFGYVLAIAPRWAYQHLGLDVSLWKLVVSYLLTAALALAFERYTRPGSASRVLLSLLLVVPIIPSLSLWALTDANAIHMLLMVSAFPVVLAVSRIRFPQIRLPGSWGVWTLRVCVLALAVTLVRLAAIVGWSNFSVNPDTAYATRKLLADSVTAGVWGYINIWSFKVFPIVLLTWSLIRRRFDWALLVLLTVAVILGFTGNRSSLLFPMLVIALYWVGERPDIARSLIRGLTAATGITTVLAVLGFDYWSSLLTRRLLYVPAQLNFAYYDYFSEHGHVYMSNSILRSFIEYPFSKQPPELIGDMLFPGYGTWSNTGFIGTGYMHFGVLGVVGFAMVVGLLVAVADNVGRRSLPAWAPIALVAIPFVSLFSSADLTTSLATHGLALSLVALATLSPPPPDTTLATRISHITVVHRPDDVRIFHKECRTLAAAGYHVSLIAPAKESYTADGIDVCALPIETSRLRRMTHNGIRALRAAVAVDAGLYHLHDPELLWAAVLLHLRGRIVVMDVHENVAGSILDKHWIPEGRRIWISRTYRALEQLCIPFMNHIVTATSDLVFLYPHKKTTAILNYPQLSELEAAPDSPYADRARAVVYAGGITRERGLFEMLDAYDSVRNTLGVSFILAGTPSTGELAAEMESHPAWSAVDYRGWVDREGLWRALGASRIGMLLFHPCPNHVTAGPNKMYEYMAAKLPLVASDFPAWREIVEHEECGLLVDPLDSAAIADAIRWLLEHPQEAAEMGARGHRAVLRRYNWEREGAQLVALYEKLLQPLAASSVVTAE